MVSRDDIYRLLRTYKANMGRCALLRAEINYVEQLSVIGSDRLIEEMALKTPARSETIVKSGISDPTAVVAIMVSDRRKEIASELGRELEEMQRELYGKLKDCRFVEGWLEGLRERERRIVEWHIIEGIPWNKVIDIFAKQFDGEYTLDGVRRIQKRAIRLIQEMSK